MKLIIAIKNRIVKEDDFLYKKRLASLMKLIVYRKKIIKQKPHAAVSTK
jgi:hypothetical protein